MGSASKCADFYNCCTGGTTLAIFLILMNVTDFFIIYLSCGAPFGVYFFLQKRNQSNRRKLYLKSLLTLFVWIPYAFQLLSDFATKKSQKEKLAAEEKLLDFQKQIAQCLIDSGASGKLFEFREILERYAGLTLACNSARNEPSAAEREIFRIALQCNIEAGANCLHRRNRLRLEFHQTLARKDFLQAVAKLRLAASDSEKLKYSANGFVEILQDAEAQNNLAEIFDESLQSRDNFNVPDSGKEECNLIKHKPLASNQNHFQALPASPPPRRAATAATTKNRTH